jgi:hypothetical protein
MSQQLEIGPPEQILDVDLSSGIEVVHAQYIMSLREQILAKM